MTEQNIKVTVRQIAPVNATTVKLSLAALNDASLPDWQPGAHIDLHLSTNSGEMIRQYSLCGEVGDRQQYQVAVLRDDDGRGGSSFIHSGLVEGDQIIVSAPRNHFSLTPAQSYLFIAGGIGITPLLPMIAAAKAAGADWELLYCARSRASMPFIDELTEQNAGRVTTHESAAKGRIDLSARIKATPDETQVYCCGPEPMIQEVEELTSLLGDRIHVERFAPRDIADDAMPESFEVEFARSGHIVTVEPGQSILEIAEDLGLDIDSSCQEGTCGSCETRVISGTPDHRCSVLTANERAASMTMMVCVSRSCGGRLVLDA